jgi:hypothetical protein
MGEWPNERSADPLGPILSMELFRQSIEPPAGAVFTRGQERVEQTGNSGMSR